MIAAKVGMATHAVKTVRERRLLSATVTTITKPQLSHLRPRAQHLHNGYAIVQRIG